MHAVLLTPGGIPDGSQGEFVYARSPLAGRLPSLSVPRVSMIYGEYDWMNWRNAADVKAGLQPDGGTPQMDVWRVAQATHQQMIDNPRGFADAVLATGGDTAGLPAGTGFGAKHGAHAKVWVRDKPLPQDVDHITIWADELASGAVAVEYTSVVPQA